MWHSLRHGTNMTLAGAAMAFGLSAMSSPATAQETIVCVGNKTGLVRIVEDEFDCKFWEHAQTIGGGDGSGVKFVFVTSMQYQGDIQLQGACQTGFTCDTGLDRAASECNRLADEAGLPGAYEPWLSTAADPAGPRFLALGADGPWFNVKGDLVAASLAGLLTLKNGTDYLYNAVRYTEVGDEVSGDQGRRVWTGTSASGLVAAHCNNWQAAIDTTSGTMGNASVLSQHWTDEVPGPCALSLRLYCFDQ
jgi:hypothetical protein